MHNKNRIGTETNDFNVAIDEGVVENLNVSACVEHFILFFFNLYVKNKKNY